MRPAFFLFLILLLGFSMRPAYGQDAASTPMPFPEPMPPAAQPSGVQNFALLGSDTTNPQNAGRTDVMTIVSVNYEAGTVALLSIPRDLYVYLPGREMARINTAYAYGGAELLRETLLYNLGLQIDGYARVNFNGFRGIVDALGGIDVAVDCAIQDWRLIEPGADPTVEANWALFTLPVGLHTFDGDLALWYARSRRTSSDYDRGRRQQVMLRAMFYRLQTLGLIEQVRDIYPQALEIVETDISLDTLVRLGALASGLTPDRLASYTFRPGVEAQSWQAPDGAAVQTPVRDALERLVAQFLTPPTALQIGREHPRIRVINATGMEQMDVVAADRLRWEGFSVTLGGQAPYQGRTQLVDFSGQSKGSSLSVLRDVLRVAEERITIMPQAERDVDFEVTLGGEYYACTYNVAPPRDITPTPASP